MNINSRGRNVNPGAARRERGNRIVLVRGCNSKNCWVCKKILNIVPAVRIVACWCNNHLANTVGSNYLLLLLPAKMFRSIDSG